MRPDADGARGSREAGSGPEIPPALRRQWWIVATVGIVSVASGAGVIAGTFGLRASFRWAVGSAVVAGFVLATFRYHLRRNHPPGAPDKRYGSVGVASAVTLLRGGLIALVAGFLLVEPTAVFAWIPAFCYGTAAGLDWVDGRLARYADRTTVLGERLDMAFDTTGLLSATLVGVRWGPIPVWYLLVPGARYVYRGALGIRLHRGLPVDDLPKSQIRRPVAGLQMAFVVGALTPVAPPGAVRAVAAVAVVVGVTVFVRDYLAVTRRFH